MATHSNIIIEYKGSYKAIPFYDKSKKFIKPHNTDYMAVYCHYDGYVSDVGKHLYNHYNTKQKVLDLISGGNMSCIEDSFFDGFIENYTETPIIHPLLCYGITRYKKHELMCNAIIEPTEFYHFHNGELIYTSRLINDVIKSIENHSGDKINETLKTQLTFNFR